MTRSTLNKIEEYAALFGINKTIDYTNNHRVEWVVLCRTKGCQSLKMHWGPGMSPDAMVSEVRKRGWQIDRGDRPLCPTCLEAIHKKARAIEAAKPKHKTDNVVALLSAKEKQEAAKEVADIVGAAAQVTEASDDDTAAAQDVVVPEVAASERALRSSPPDARMPAATISRQVYGLLEDHLDERLGCYLHGYSDERIAAEVGCHVGIVRDIRMGAFCELIEDVRISALRADLAAFEKALDKITLTARADIKALQSRLEQIALATKSR